MLMSLGGFGGIGKYNEMERIREGGIWIPERKGMRVGREWSMMKGVKRKVDLRGT